MMEASERFMTAIGNAADVEWYRLVGGIDHGGTWVPPLLVWRYVRPVPHVELLTRNVVEDFTGAVAWTHDQPGRNWILVPRRIIDLQRERSLPTDTAAIRVLMDEDQAFCQASVGDLECLADEVEVALDVV